MGQVKVAGRYAKSLLQLATEKNEVEQVKGDILLLNATIAESKDLELLLKSPIVREDKKAAILAKVFDGKIGDMASKFVAILTKKGREALLPEICASFMDQYRTLNNIQKVTLISAVPLDDATKKALFDKVNLGEDGTLQIEEQIDPELIGGFVLKIGDKQVDASVLGSFRQLRKDFKNNPFVANL